MRGTDFRGYRARLAGLVLATASITAGCQPGTAAASAIPSLGTLANQTKAQGMNPAVQKVSSQQDPEKTQDIDVAKVVDVQSDPKTKLEEKPVPVVDMNGPPLGGWQGQKTESSTLIDPTKKIGGNNPIGLSEFEGDGAA